jgi:hypothetical protein
MLIFGGMTAFLKFVVWCSVGTLATGAIYETRELWKGSFTKMKSKNVDTIFTKHKEHSTVLGITRHGKTYAAIKSLRLLRDEAVFFYNTQHEKVGEGWTTVDPNVHEWEQVEYLLSKNKKVNWLPSTKIDDMQNEIVYIVDRLYNGESRNVRIAFDEVHLFTKNALKQIQRIATTGLRWGMRGVFISQRPAKVDNTLYTQSTNHVIFALGSADYQYLHGQGFPIDELKQKIQGEKYIFVNFDQKEVSEPKKIH